MIYVAVLFLGAADLVEASEGADHVMLVGVTCGLSAPYVAGQIDHAMKQVRTQQNLNCPHNFVSAPFGALLVLLYMK